MATTSYGVAHVDSDVIIEDDSDSTKKLKYQLCSLASATTVTWTVPDQNLDLTPGSGDFAASGGAAEANTMSSAGTGVETFNAKAGVDFPMRDLVGLSTGGIDVVLNSSDIEFDLDIANMSADASPAGTDEVAMQTTGGGALQKATLTNLSKGIDHDATVNFVSDEHVAHAGVSVTAGVGLSGGGAIDATRTLTLDLNELGNETTIAAGDFIPMVDITDSGSQKITLANLEAVVDHDALANFDTNEHFLQSAITATGTITTGDWTSASIISARATVTPVSGDMLLVEDATDGDLKQVDASNFLAGAGDMVLADAQTNTGVKTFEDATLLLENVAQTFTISFTNTITANRVITFADEAGTVAIAGGAYHDGFSDFASNEHFTQAAITTVGTVTTGDVDAVVSTANLTTPGIIEIATGAETNTGTDATRAVSPDGLDDWTGSAQVDTVGTLASGDVTTQVSASSETLAGRIELATQTEADTGTDDARAVTPLKLDSRLQQFRGVNAQTGTSYTALAGDAGKIVTMDNASANTFSINDSVFANGDVITVCQKGAGATTINGSASNNVPAAKTLVLTEQWALASVVILVEGASTISVVDGNLTAA